MSSQNAEIVACILTITLRARVFYEQIVNEAQPSWLSRVENEGQQSNCFSIVVSFPASRGLSRQGKMKREERDLFRLPTSFLSRMSSRFLNNQWHFLSCVNTTQRTGLNLSASASGCWIWARAQILIGPIRVEDETTVGAAVVVDPITSLWGKPKRGILRQIFRSLRAFRPVKHTYLEWHLLGFMELLVSLRFGTFLFEEKAICRVTSGQRWMESFYC